MCKEIYFTEVNNVKNFNLTHIFECGQCFRWNKTDSESYIGVAFDKVIELSFQNDKLTIYNSTDIDFNSVWENYFDFNFDYTKAKSEFSNDLTLKDAVIFGDGIRILNQDLWECIISFIISANNNIPRIKGIIERFCELYGKEIIYKGKKYYTFPRPEELKGISTNDLAPLRAGFRDKYIVDAVNKVNSGEVSLDLIKSSDTKVAREELLKIKGVGRKVSDCVLLFGAGKREVFPVDVWVKRVMNELYYDELSGGDIFAFADKKFGKNAGLAQQYLFYYMRENSKEAK